MSAIGKRPQRPLVAVQRPVESERERLNRQRLAVRPTTAGRNFQEQPFNESSYPASAQIGGPRAHTGTAAPHGAAIAMLVSPGLAPTALIKERDSNKSSRNWIAVSAAVNEPEIRRYRISAMFSRSSISATNSLSSGPSASCAETIPMGCPFSMTGT